MDESTNTTETNNSTFDAHGLALATIGQLDERLPCPERAKYKFNMIQIAERSAAGIEVNEEDARLSIIAAAEWCERQAA